MKKGKQTVIDGKYEGPKSNKRTLFQVLGYTGTDKYGTMDVAEYAAQINAMNKSDLHKHAVEHSLLPIDNRDILEKRLVKEFEKHVASFEDVKETKFEPKNKSLNKQALDILSNAR